MNVIKPKTWAAAVLDFTGGSDEKVHKIVAEVDQFMKSVHADIEDWKFSMEDYGDGTRIFLRLQVHINKVTGTSPHPRSKGAAVNVGGDTAHLEGRLVLDGPAPPTKREVAEDLQEPGQTASVRRGEDLASFVDVWRHKRDTNLDGEFHKDGAPFVDGHLEWKGQKRSSDDAGHEQVNERTVVTPTKPAVGPKRPHSGRRGVRASREERLPRPSSGHKRT
jgi:hypothetical protein